MQTVLAFHKVTTGVTFGATNYSQKRLFALLERWREDHSDVLDDVTLTFDDGYAHLATVLTELSSRFPAKIIVFIPTAWIGKSNRWDYSSWLRPERHLDCREVASLARSGVVIGSHGHSHRDLTALGGTRLAEELRQSRDILEQIVGTSVRVISYPFGRADQRVAALAAECGYRTGYTMYPPRVSDADLLAGRIPVYAYDTPLSLSLKTREGQLRRLEEAKSRIANRLSGGTRLWQRLAGPAG